MAQRDYVSRGHSGARRRRNNRKNINYGVSKTMMILAIALLMTFAGGLFFIAQNKLDEVQPLSGHHSQTGNGLPPKPEERWSYIKELENRQVGVTRPVEPSENEKSNFPTQLSNEQRQLLEQIQADMRQQPTELVEVPSNPHTETPRTTVINTNPETSHQHQVPKEAQAPQQTAALPLQKQAEISQLSSKAEKKTEALSHQRWILQCGSFRGTDEAESVRAQLAFSGIESRITSNGGWHRVVLGPYSSRVRADNMLSRLRDAGTPGCIALSTGG